MDKRCMYKTLAVLIVASAVIGCVTVEQKEATLKSQYPNLDDGTIKKIAHRQIEKGMTTDMVIAAMGKKGKVKSGKKFGEEMWIYYGETGASQTSFIGPVFTVWFENGKVTQFEGDPRQYR